MQTFFTSIFDPSGFPARWQCGTWSAGLGWLHIGSDLAVWAAYTAIPGVLAYFVLRRKDVPFPPVFWLFAVFIFSCGLGHLIEAAIFWWPAYRFSGAVKAVTAISSWATVFALIHYTPEALRLPGLARVNAELEREISERRRAEEALRVSEARLQAVLDNSPTVIYMKDRRGRYSLVNREWERVMSTERTGALGRTDHELFSGLPMKGFPSNESSVWETREAQQGEDRLQVNGREQTFLSVQFVLADETGDPYALCGISTDVTERKAAEEEQRRLMMQIQQSQKLESLGVLAGGIAHDFNNLLTGILGNASLMLAALPKESPHRASLKEIETASHRAAELANQMLAYSGKGRFIVGPIDLSSLVEEMTHLLKSSISKKATLTMDLAPSLPMVEGDVTQVRQIVMNVLTNASDALGSEPGEIQVRTTRRRLGPQEARRFTIGGTIPEGDYVQFEVSDTGCGMDDATMERIFDPFFSTKFTGRGLGLAAALGIVRGHGGAIAVRSRSGEGTTFTIVLPAARSATGDVATRIPAITAAWKGTGTILVIEDEAVVRAFARRALEIRGFKVLEAIDGADGIRMFREHADAISAVLLDLTMPVMNGVQVYELIRETRTDIPVILASGFDESEATRDFPPAALRGFLKKPYGPDELIERVREALEGS